MATQTATILVSDLVGSTELRAALGEDRAEEVRRLHDRALTEAAERAGGIVVKGLGDGLLVQFAGAAEAVGVAVGMQQAIDALGRRDAPFVEALNDWLRSTPASEVVRVLGTEASVIGRLAPAVHGVLADVPAPADLGPDEAEARLNDAIGQVLARMTADRPALLVLDDLHWADAAGPGLGGPGPRRRGTAGHPAARRPRRPLRGRVGAAPR